jgi:hypothetical protein
MELVRVLGPTIVALIAVLISGYSLMSTKRQNRRSVFLDMHARMLDPEIFRGRRILLEKINSLEDARTLRKEQPNEYELVNRALAMLEVLACYVHRGYLDRDLVLDEWGYLYADAWTHGRHFLLARHEDLGHDRLPWPHLRIFGPATVAWSRDRKRTTETAHRAEVLALQGLVSPDPAP